MAKIPYVRFYMGDWLVGVQNLDMSERGQYMTLLAIQHQKGRLSRKTIELVLGTKIQNVPSDVLTKFVVDAEGLYYNERMEQEMQKIDQFSDNQKEKAIKRWHSDEPEANQQTSRGNAVEYANGYAGGHAKTMPVINDNDNDIKNKKKKESERKEEKDANFLKREQVFRLEVIEKGHSIYHPDMIANFCNYWTEPNRSRTKMRFELEKVFDISRRLGTWFARSNESKTVEKKGDLITYKELVYRFNQGEADMWEKYIQVTPGDKRSMWKLKTK